MHIRVLVSCLFLLQSFGLFGQTAFQKTFGGSGNESATSAIQAADGNFLVIGHTTSFGSGGEDGLLMKIDPSGNAVWTQTIGGASDDRFMDVIQLPNTDFLVVGWTESYGSGNKDVLVARVDNGGNLIWSRTFGGATLDMVTKLIPTSDNNILVGGYTDSFGVGLWDVLLLKIDGNGNTVWSKTYGQSGNDFINGFGMIEDAQGNYVLAGAWTFGLGIPMHNGFILKVNPNGNLLSSQIYGGTNNDSFSGHLKEHNGGLQNIGISWSWNGSNHEIWMSELNAAGTTNWSKTFGVPNENIRIGTVFETTNQEYLISAYEHTSPSSGNALMVRINTSGNIVWARSYGGSGVDRFHAILESGNSVFAFGHTTSSGNGGEDLLMVRADSLGNVPGCSSILSMTTTNVTPTEFQPSPIENTPSLGQTASPSTLAINLQDSLICSNALPVAHFSASNDSICVGDCINLTNHSSFFTTWQWTFTGTNPTTSSASDPQNLCFSAPGTFPLSLIASNTFGSDTFSLSITVFPTPTADLGPDTVLCQGDSLVLHAFTQQGTYLWFDQTTDVAKTVNASGTYWVQVTNQCGTAMDTLELAIHDPPQLNLGPDTTLCSGLSLLLDASFPNATYRWSNQATNATQTIAEAGTHWAEVTTACGTAVDSIVLNFHPNAQPDLGQDTAICSGQLLQLNATTPNATYLWFNQATGPTQQVSESGRYWVQVTDTCSTYTDSITVTVHDPIQLNLGEDTILCAGDSIVLETSLPTLYPHLWQNGTTTHQQTVHETGTYWVVVSSACGLVSDTLHVEVVAPPTLTISKDTLMCSGDSVELMASTSHPPLTWMDGLQSSTRWVRDSGRFTVSVSNSCGSAQASVQVGIQGLAHFYLGEDRPICPGELIQLSAPPGLPAYTWQNGSSKAQFLANVPGTYSVVATNAAGCLITDSVTLYPCSQLWVPNAFTPGGNQLNETFQPVGEQLLDIQFEVYNRWGERIFQSNSLLEGWNGSYQGVPSPIGTYVWKLHYTDHTGIRKFGVGSFQLIR